MAKLYYVSNRLCTARLVILIDSCRGQSGKEHFEKVLISQFLNLVLQHSAQKAPIQLYVDGLASSQYDSEWEPNKATTSP